MATLRVGDRLAALEIEGDPDAAVRAAFGASYQRLAASERQLFRLLGLVPGPHFTAAAAAALVGPGAGDIRQSLDRLAAAHLVDQYVPGRYRLHDLLRLYAAERAQEIDPRERAAATRRLLELYLRGADAAARLLYPRSCGSPRPATPARRGRRRSPDVPRPWNGWTSKPPTCWRPSAMPPTTDHVRWPACSPTPSAATSGCGPPQPGRTSPAPPGRPRSPRATCARRSRRP